MDSSIRYLKSLNQQIVEYTDKFSDLQKSHHWLFDLPPFKNETLDPKYIVFGINPGESKEKYFDSIVQESRFYDFHEEIQKGKRQQLSWTKTLYRFLGTKKIIQTELFFWSTKNIKILNERFGPLKTNPHLVFCTDLNKKLIAFHNPDTIVCPGLGMSDIIPDKFNLRLLKKIRANNGHRLIEHYKDKENRDWLITKHWSGARGFTTDQRNMIKNYIHEIS